MPNATLVSVADNWRHCVTSFRFLAAHTIPKCRPALGRGQTRTLTTPVATPVAAPVLAAAPVTNPPTEPAARYVFLQGARAAQAGVADEVAERREPGERASRLRGGGSAGPAPPEGHHDRAELEATLRSPQLRQSIASLVSALQTDNFSTVLPNFGLDLTSCAAKLAFGDNVGTFLEAIKRWAGQQDRNMSSGDQH